MIETTKGGRRLARVPARAGVFLLAAMLATPGGLRAQAAVPDRLSLDEALRIARLNSPQYLQAQNDIPAAEANERSGFGSLLPSVNASMSLGGYSNRRVTGEDDFGQPTRLPDAIDYQGSNTSQRFGLSMILFDGGATWQQWRAARHRVSAAEAATETTWQRTRAQVVNAYDAVLEADRSVTLTERLLASARERVETMEARLRLGVTDPVDVLGADVDVAQQELAVAQARGEARKARLVLMEALGVGGEPAFEPTDEPPPVFDPSGLSAEGLVSEALAGSPRVRQRVASAEAAERSASAQRRGRWWPRVSGDMGFGRSMSLSSYDALTEFNPQNQSFSFGLSASLPVFDGFQRRANIAQAEAAVDDADLQLRAERIALEREVRAAVIDLENAHSSLQLAERTAELSRQQVELAQEKFRFGGNVNFLDLQNLIERAANAERSALRARFSFEQARVNLEQLVGREVGR